MASHNMVRFDVVWHHLASPSSDGEGGAIFSTASEVLDMARFATAFAVGATFNAVARVGLVGLVGLVGAGDTVEVREGLFVGDGSDAGKSPRGCWRVATIFSSTNMRPQLNTFQKGKRVEDIEKPARRCC
jgi:hypothetical protein